MTASWSASVGAVDGDGLGDGGAEAGVCAMAMR